MMLHTDVEGQINRPIPALPVAEINKLRSYVDYLALGHTHKSFEIDGWVYNPGSLEACSVDEYANVRGAYLVEVSDGKHTARLVRDYHQRPVLRLSFDVSDCPTPEELRETLFSQLRHEVTPHNPSDTMADTMADTGTSLWAEAAGEAPVIELTLRGRLGFKSSLLEINRLREEIKEFNPLLVMMKNQTVPVEYAVAAGLSEGVPRGARTPRHRRPDRPRFALPRSGSGPGRPGHRSEATGASRRAAPRIVEMIERKIAETQSSKAANAQ